MERKTGKKFELPKAFCENSFLEFNFTGKV